MPFPTASPWHVLTPLPGRSVPSRLLFLLQEPSLDITSSVKPRLPQYFALCLSYSLAFWSNLCIVFLRGFQGGSVVKNSTCQFRNCQRCSFDPWVGKIPFRWKWQPLQYSCWDNPMIILWTDEPGRLQSLGWSCKESDMTEWLNTNTHCLSYSRWWVTGRQVLNLTFIFVFPVISQNFRTFQQPILWQSNFSKDRGKPVILTLVHTRIPTIVLSIPCKNWILLGWI